jgi:hypothetical protein
VRAEQQAVVRALAAFFEARDEPAVLPRLRYYGRTQQLACYEEGVREAIIAAVKLCTDTVRAEQRWSSTLDSEASVVKAVDALAGGNAAAFDNHAAFIALAAGFGVEVEFLLLFCYSLMLTFSSPAPVKGLLKYNKISGGGSEPSKTHWVSGTADGICLPTAVIQTLIGPGGRGRRDPTDPSWPRDARRARGC